MDRNIHLKLSMNMIKSFKEFINEELVDPHQAEFNDIISSLYRIPMKVQMCHHATGFHSKHEALGIYNDLQAMRDDLIEKILGYSGRKYDRIDIGFLQFPGENYVAAVADEIISFAKYLEDWARSNSYSDIENSAQEYSGHGAKLRYLLTLH